MNMDWSDIGDCSKKSASQPSDASQDLFSGGMSQFAAGDNSFLNSSKGLNEQYSNLDVIIHV